MCILFRTHFKNSLNRSFCGFKILVPTLVFPFALVTAILSGFITWLVGLFGFHFVGIKTKNVLKWFLRKEVLISALLLNVGIYGGVKAYSYISHRARPLAWVVYQNRLALPAPRAEATYTNTSYKTEIEMSAPTGAIAGTGVQTQIRMLWEQKMPEGSFRGFVRSGESLFFSGLGGRLYEVSAADGQIQRQWYIGKISVPSPLVWNGILFAGEGDHETHHARVYGIDLSSGKLVGVVSTLGHTEGDLVIDGAAGEELLYVAAGRDGIYAADPKVLSQKLNGATADTSGGVADADHRSMPVEALSDQLEENIPVVWHKDIGHFDSGVVYAEGLVFATTAVEKHGPSGKPNLYALTAKTGEIAWQRELPASAWSRPLVVDSDVCVTMGEIYAPSAFGQVACFDRVSGANTKSYIAEEPLFSPPLIYGDALLTIGIHGQLCSLKQSNLSVNWCRKVSKEKKLFVNLEANSAGQLILPLSDKLLVIDPSSGEAITSWSPEKTGLEWKPHYAKALPVSNYFYTFDSGGSVRYFESF